MQINQEFLNNIETKYNYYFRFDRVHSSLIRKARVTNKLCHYIHIIECCIPLLKEKKDRDTIEYCKFCQDPSQMDRAIGFISLYSKQLVTIFVCYFNCTLRVANDFFSRFKISTFTLKGMSLFDQFTASLAYIKHINKVEKQKNPNFDPTWFDGFYFNKEIESFEKNIKWIREQKEWKKIAYFGATGTTHTPEHFFAIFLDVNAKEAFIYNSQVVEEKYLIKNLKTELSEYTFILNKYSNQFKNQLCGFFALNFIEKMMTSQDLHKCFALFNVEKNRDAEIYYYQNKSVLPLQTDVKMLQIFLENWKTN